MSELYLTDSETKGFPAKGDTDFLTPAETAFMQRVLRRVEVFPQEFWKAIIQKVALDGEPVPRSQVQGLAQFGINAADAITTSQSTQSTSYTNLSTVGPTIDGISDGTYVVMISAFMLTDNSSGIGRMTVRENDDSSTDSDVKAIAFTGSQGATASTQFVVDLRNSGNNKLEAKYKINNASFTATFANRTMFALKVGN